MCAKCNLADTHNLEAYAGFNQHEAERHRPQLPGTNILGIDSQNSLGSNASILGQTVENSRFAVHDYLNLENLDFLANRILLSAGLFTPDSVVRLL